MDENQQEAINDDFEYKKLLAELKNQSEEAKKILNVLKPLVDSGNIHKSLFDELYKAIIGSHKELIVAKGLNTKYSNSLVGQKEKIENFINDVNGHIGNTKKILESIKNSKIKALSRLEAINNLKAEANEAKKNVTEQKNTINKLLLKIKSLEQDSIKLLKKIRDEKNESKRITTFLLTKEKEVSTIHNTIIKKYSDLFLPTKDKASKIEKLEKSMNRIGTFNDFLKNEIEPDLKGKRKYLDELQTDINTKKADIETLLSDATVKTLAQGYQESKEEYSREKKVEYKTVRINRKILSNLINNIQAFLFNVIVRNSTTFLNYIIFISPLIAICLIFIEPDFITNIFDFSTKEVDFTGTEFILYKISVSLPLLWVAWFGQKNISQRKRLSEEYNHKLRVIQMYLLFNTNEKSYNLEQKKELEGTLLGVINDNPAEHLGKGETMIDSILEKFYIAGFYKKLKKEITSEIASTIAEKK